MLEDNSLNINLFFNTLVKDESLLILRVDDELIEKAENILEKAGFNIVER